MHQITYKCVYWDHSLCLELAQRNVNCPAIGANIAKAVIGEIDTFTNAHTRVAQQQEDVGRQIVAAEQLLLDRLILLRRQGTWKTLRRPRSSPAPAANTPAGSSSTDGSTPPAKQQRNSSPDLPEDEIDFLEFRDCGVPKVRRWVVPSGVSRRASVCARPIRHLG